MPVAMTHDGSLERNSLGDLYVRHADRCGDLYWIVSPE